MLLGNLLRFLFGLLAANLFVAGISARNKIVSTKDHSVEAILFLASVKCTSMLMTTDHTIVINNTTYDCSKAVAYHEGQFPPDGIDLNVVFESLTQALQQLVRYDEKLRHMPNSELLLAPLMQRDAVVSSRMEGTISTLEEVLRLEAGENANRTDGTGRSETLEVALYARALRQAEHQMRDGIGLSEYLIKTAHETLLSHGRGADKSPGQYKTHQNYVGDQRQRQISFIPISPESLIPGIRNLIEFVAESPVHALLKTAIAHAEFEALHPFEDGNGRVGRMLIPLMLWDSGVLTAPHFFVSDYFERHKDEYIERLRNVSSRGDWDNWCVFFLTALEAQATANIDVVTQVQAHYEEMKERFREVLRSQHFEAAVDYVFTHPIFWNNHFVETAQAPSSTLRNFTPRLVDEGLLRVIHPPSGSAPGLYIFPSLLDIIRTP